MMLKIKLLIPLTKSGWLYAGLLLFVVGVKFYAAGGFNALNQFNHDWLKWISSSVLAEEISQPTAAKKQQLIYLTMDFSADSFTGLAQLLQDNPNSQIVFTAKPNRKLIQQLHYLLQLKARDKAIIWIYQQKVSSPPLSDVQINNSELSELFNSAQLRFYQDSSVNWYTSADLIYAPAMLQNNQSSALIWQADGELYLSYLGQIIQQQWQQLSLENSLLSSQLVNQQSNQQGNQTSDQLDQQKNTLALGFSGQLKALLSSPNAISLQDYLASAEYAETQIKNSQQQSTLPAIILISEQADRQADLIAKQIEAWLHNELYYQSISAELCFILLFVLAFWLSLALAKAKLLYKLVFIATFCFVALSLQAVFYWQQQWLSVIPILAFLLGVNLIVIGFQTEQAAMRTIGAMNLTPQSVEPETQQPKPEEISQHDKQELAAQETAESLERTILITDNQANTSRVTQAIYKIENFGRYKVEGILGKGAMGIVYQGVDPKINRHVAIKTLQLNDSKDDDLIIAKSRFFKEAETAGNLSHANIVTIYDVGEEADLGYIAMDLLTGAPLSKYSKPGTCLPMALVYQLMIQITDALDYAHNQQVVHRDIKPANIIYDDEKQRVTVTDFGIAYVADSSKTSTGTIMGSPYYMSPEQVLGQQVDGRSDIFSLGVTFYQLLTGYLPFEGDSIASVAYQITQAKQAPIKKWNPKLPSSATRITNKAMHKDIDKRYQTMAEFKQALINALKRDFKKAPII